MLTLLQSCQSNAMAESGPPLAFFGDSLTAGTGGTPYGLVVGKLLNRPTITSAIGGLDAEQIAVFQGGKPLLITLEGNQFNRLNPVKLSKVSTKFLSPNANLSLLTAKGTVAGVPCKIIRSVNQSDSAQNESYSIVPNGMTVKAIPPDSVFILDEAEKTKSLVQVLWYGRNNYYLNRPDASNATGEIMAALDASIAYLPEPKRYLVLGVLPRMSEGKGTSVGEMINAHNGVLEVKYPGAYVAVTPPTSAELKAVGYSPTQQDKANLDNGIFPAGMHFDNTHLNNIGYQIIANRVVALLRTLNY
ncbi:SGNH/GDSL hydrolase family protein [Spirosoma horti]